MRADDSIDTVCYHLSIMNLQTFQLANLQPTDIKDFQNLIWSFYHQNQDNKKDLLWRNTHDPYKILVSEIMLQQTQITRVISKYLTWLERFPDLQTLAESPQNEVLKYWSGLGYNRRALALHKLSKVVESEFEGSIPLDIFTLKKLPGIGDYTASAIYTFSTNKPSIFIETNIRTVFIYHFFPEINHINDKDIFPLIEKTLAKENPREWYYALMDYGSYLKKEYGNPNAKSKHYAKHSKFEGSKRQLRGRILKKLDSENKLTLETILEFTDKTQSEVEKIVDEMVMEGFIIREANKLYLVK